MLRRFTTLVVALVATLSLAAPALAGSSYISKSTGKSADAYWTQIDGIPVGTGPFGNVHVGYLSVYETSKGVGDVFVYIDDFDCEEGEEPYGGGHGFEEEGGCDYVGSRFGEGFGLSFTVDRKLNTASLVGSVTMTSGGGHGGGGEVVGNPPINMSWSAQGNVIKDWYTYRYNDGTTTYMDRYRANYRMASLSGTIGPMSFDPALSGGTISSFSAFSKSRTK